MCDALEILSQRRSRATITASSAFAHSASASTRPRPRRGNPPAQHYRLERTGERDPSRSIATGERLGLRPRGGGARRETGERRRGDGERRRTGLLCANVALYQSCTTRGHEGERERERETAAATHLDLERIGLALLLLLLDGLLPTLRPFDGPLLSRLRLLEGLLARLLPSLGPPRDGGGGLLVLLRPLGGAGPLPLRDPAAEAFGGGGLRLLRGGEGGSRTTATTVPSIWPQSM